MTEWYPITAKFTAEEKRILDILRDTYGLNYNKSLKAGIEMFARLIAMVEYCGISDSKIIQKINKISKKYMRLMDAEINTTLKEFPEDQQKEEYEKFSTDRTKIFSNFDNVFVKNRKKGRKKLPRKKGRPSTRL